MDVGFDKQQHLAEGQPTLQGCLPLGLYLVLGDTLKFLGKLAVVPVLFTAFQYGQRGLLDRRVSTLPLGSSEEATLRALGKPDSESDTSFRDPRTGYSLSSKTLSYGFGIPLACFSPQEWALEFSDQKLVSKFLLVSP
jgi:hypothetical protein